MTLYNVLSSQIVPVADERPPAARAGGPAATPPRGAGGARATRATAPATAGPRPRAPP